MKQTESKPARMSRKKPWSPTADFRIIIGALKEQRRLSPRTIKRIEASLRKFCGIWKASIGLKGRS